MMLWLLFVMLGGGPAARVPAELVGCEKMVVVEPELGENAVEGRCFFSVSGGGCGAVRGRVRIKLAMR